MKKNSTLFSPADSSVSIQVETDCRKLRPAAPKAATIERIRQFARVAFSDTSLAGLPAIVLN